MTSRQARSRAAKPERSQPLSLAFPNPAGSANSSLEFSLLALPIRILYVDTNRIIDVSPGGGTPWTRKKSSTCCFSAPAIRHVRSWRKQSSTGSVKAGSEAFSAGSHPKGEVNPYALATLKKANYLTEGFRSKSWDEFTGADAPPLDFVFTLCDDAAAEKCPYWPGQPMTAHWGLPDPAAFEGTEVAKHLAFADTFRMLNNRISIFTALPLKSIDKLSLQHRLDEIGRTVPRSESA